MVVRDQRLVLAEADLLQHLAPAGGVDRIAERVEDAEIDAAAMREELLVQRHRVELRPEQMEAQRIDAARRRTCSSGLA